MIRILMVEDDEDDGRALMAQLERYAAEHGEKFQIQWLKTAFEFTQDRPACDLIFMDIQLPGINGMEAAETLRTYDSETPLIFVTDLAKYAVRGYAVDALDFIVKPVVYEDFCLRMAKALRVIGRKSGRSIFIPAKDGLTVLPASDVTAIDVQGHNLAYHVAGKPEPFVCRGSLAQAEADLAGSSFVRVSASCLVNMEHVRKIAGTELHMSTGEIFYISRAKRKDALAAIANYYGGNA